MDCNGKMTISRHLDSFCKCHHASVTKNGGGGQPSMTAALAQQTKDVESKLI